MLCDQVLALSREIIAQAPPETSQEVGVSHHLSWFHPLHGRVECLVRPGVVILQVLKFSGPQDARVIHLDDPASLDVIGEWLTAHGVPVRFEPDDQ